jgi:hypothetical protein
MDQEERGDLGIGLRASLIQVTLHDVDAEHADHLDSDLSEITLEEEGFFSAFFSSLRFGRKDDRGFAVDEVSYPPAGQHGD